MLSLTAIADCSAAIGGAPAGGGMAHVPIAVTVHRKARGVGRPTVETDSMIGVLSHECDDPVRMGIHLRGRKSNTARAYADTVRTLKTRGRRSKDHCANLRPVRLQQLGRGRLLTQ